MIPNWLYVYESKGGLDIQVIFMSPSDSADLPGSILYHSESSEVPIPLTSNWPGTFFAVSYSKPALPTLIWPKLDCGNDFPIASQLNESTDIEKHFLTLPNVISRKIFSLTSYGVYVGTPIFLACMYT